MWNKNVFGYGKNYYNETLHAQKQNPIAPARRYPTTGTQVVTQIRVAEVFIVSRDSA